MASFVKAFVFLVLICLVLVGTGAAQEAPTVEPAPQLSAEAQQAFIDGVGLLEGKQYPEAAEKFGQVTADAPDYEPGFYYLGQARLAAALAGQGDLQAALDAFLRARELKPLRPGTSFMIGKIYEASGVVPEAIRAYRGELRVRGREDAAEVYNALGRVYVNSGDVGNAQTALREAIEADPNYVEARFNLGRALRAIGDDEGAVKALLRARQVLEEWDSKKRRLDILAEQQKRDPELTEEIVTEEYGMAQNFAEEIGGWPALNKALGDAYDALGDYDYARNAYRASMALTQRGNETDPDAHTRIGLSFLHEATELLTVQGSILQSVHMFDAAIEELETALKNDANYAGAYDGLGQVYMIQALNFETDVGRDIKSHSLDEANTEFKKAIDLRQDYPPFHDHLGLAAYHAGNYPEAIQSFQRALELDPNFPDAYADLAAAYVAVGQHEDALSSGEIAASLAPNNVTAQIALGLASYFTDDIAKATRHFDRAISIRPEDYRSYVNLGNCYYVRESWHRAREEYRQALGRVPGVRIKGTAIQRSYIYYLIGQTYHNGLLYDQAIKAYNEALAIDPSYYDALLATARAYTALKRYKAAERALNTALQLSPGTTEEARVHQELGQMYEQQGRVHEAAAEYTRALRADPNSLEAQRAIQRLQL